MKRIVSGMMLTLLMLSMLTSAFNIQPVRAIGTIYIRADGSVDPPTAPISSVDNVTYTFTDSINDSIIVERDNIVVDGAGYAVQGTGAYDSKGIDLSYRSNITIKNMKITTFSYGIYLNSSYNNKIGGNNITNNWGGFWWGAGVWLSSSNNNSIVGNNITKNWDHGIWLEDSSDNSIVGNSVTASEQYGIMLGSSSNNSISGNNITNNNLVGIGLSSSNNNSISGNNITSNGYGVWLSSSSGNMLRGNRIDNNVYNFGVDGMALSHYINDIDTSNTVEDKPVYYWINRSDAFVPPDSGHIALINCTRITIQNLLLSKNRQGLLVAYTTNSTITKCNITANSNGIGLYSSSNITISQNNITKNGSGAYLAYSSNNSIVGNNITDNGFGIYLSSSSDNSIVRNNITKNYDYGVWLSSSNNNIISGNTITDNNWSGIGLSSSSNNTVSGNNITNNKYVGIGFEFVIWLYPYPSSSNNNSIVGNNITENMCGIYLSSSSNNLLRSNRMVNNTYNFCVEGDSLLDFVNDIDVSNTVNGKPIYYWVNKQDLTVPLDAGYVALVNCTRITAQNLNLTNNGQGILLFYSNNTSIRQNNIANNGCGIGLSSSSNNTVSGNNITKNYDILFDIGIGSWGGFWWGTGVWLSSSSSNTVSGNNITENKYGVLLGSSSNNYIYHNNFINNTLNAYSYGPSNIWNSPQPITYIYNGSEYVNYLGNYWSDYSGIDANNDGVGDTAYSINAEEDYYPLMQPFEVYFQIPSTTELTMNETASTTHALTETIISQNATLNTSVTGDFNATLNLTNLEIVLITSGSFAGKGFSKGNWSTNIEGNPYEGSWQGMLFKKPEERKIYLKGMISGGLRGIVEGFLSESVNGSEIYDQYQATWTISHIGADVVFAKLNLNGTVNYQESVEYSSKLYALQTFIQGQASGYYDGSLSVVLTHIRIDDETNPYYGQGFSIISYVAESGSGEGWTYDTITSPEVEMNGLFTGSFTGIVSGKLESKSSRTLSLSIERINIGLPPTADLRITISGPERVSPGQTINYAIEYGNDGTKAADNVLVFSSLDPLVEYVSASEGAFYDEFTHTVYWNLPKVMAKSNGYLSIQARIPWGLPDGTILSYTANISDTDKGIFVNGIGAFGPWLFRNKEEQKKCDEYCSKNSLRWIKAFQGDPFKDRDDVEAAYKGEATDTNHLGDVNGEYDEAHGFSGGTTVIIRQILNGTLKIKDKIVLISPFWGDPPEENWKVVYKLHEKCPDATIEIWQSPNDILEGAEQYQVKIPPEVSEPWLNVVNRPDVKKHIDLFYAACAACEKNERMSSSGWHIVTVARDPNIKYGSEGYVLAGQKLDYKVEYENEGEGIAFGVYFTDTLDEDLNASTLEVGPVISTKDGSVIAGLGTYNPSTRTITWFVGEVTPGEGGYANFSAQVRNDVLEYTEIINSATVYFPSVPETTRTNAIVSVVGQPNIAVTNVTSSESMIEKGSTLNINVTVANEGYYPETFNLTLYADATVIQTQNVTLLGRNSDIITFLWNTTGFAKGNYTISAYAWPVPNEVKIDDNSYVDGTVQIRVSGDDVPPVTALDVGEPKTVTGDVVYLTSHTPITLTAEDNPDGSGIASTSYRIRNSTHDTGWLTYIEPFNLTGFADGTYFIDFNSIDCAGNMESTNTFTAILDNTPPTTTLTMGEPKYLSKPTYVTPETPFTLEADDKAGSGNQSTVYRITNSASYDSGWLTYTKPFNLTSLRDGNCTIAFNSTDNVGNVEDTNSMNVTLVGPDVNGDGKVDVKDIAIVGRALGSYPGHPRWDPIADFNLDCKVNIRDIALVARMFGKHYP